MSIKGIIVLAILFFYSYLTSKKKATKKRIEHTKRKQKAESKKNTQLFPKQAEPTTFFERAIASHKSPSSSKRQNILDYKEVEGIKEVKHRSGNLTVQDVAMQERKRSEERRKQVKKKFADRKEKLRSSYHKRESRLQTRIKRSPLKSRYEDRSINVELTDLTQQKREALAFKTEKKDILNGLLWHEVLSDAKYRH